MLVDMYAIPNGGFRRKSEAGRLKAEGVKANIPDVHLPFPSGGFHSLYLEFKLPKDPITGAKATYANKGQKETHERLRSYDNRVEVVRSVDEARSIVIDYLTKPARVLHA